MTSINQIQSEAEYSEYISILSHCKGETATLNCNLLEVHKMRDGDLLTNKIANLVLSGKCYVRMQDSYIEFIVDAKEKNGQDFIDFCSQKNDTLSLTVDFLFFEADDSVALLTLVNPIHAHNDGDFLHIVGKFSSLLFGREKYDALMLESEIEYEVEESIEREMERE